MNYLIYSKSITKIEDFYNLENIENQCIEDYSKSKSFKTKIIFPTNKLCLYREKEFIDNLWKKSELPYSGELYYNFSDFLKLITYNIDYKLHKKLLTEDIFISFIEIAYPKANFIYYSNHTNIPTKKMSNLLTDIIWGLIKKGIKVEDLENDLKDNETKFSNKDKLHDVISIYKELNKLITDYYTESDLIELLIHQIESENWDFDNGYIYYFQYFKEFKKREIDLLKVLIDKGSKIVIKFDFLAKNNPQIPGYNGLNDLITLNSELEIINNNNEINTFITENLFKYDNKISKKIDTKNEINVFECEDKKSEIEFISKLVKKLIVEDNYEAKDIMIFARNPADYSKALKFKFDNASIPFNISDRYSVKNSPIVDLILTYLEFINSGFNNKYLFKIIKSPWFNYDDHFNKSEFIKITEKYRFNYNNLDYRLKKVDSLISKIKSEKDINALHTYKSYLNYIFKFYNIDKLKNNFKRKSLNELVNTFIKLIDFKNVFNLERIEDIDENNIEFKYFYHTREKERIFSAIKSFMDILDNTLYINHKFKDKKFKLADLLETLYFVLDRKRYQIRELYDTSVTLTSIEQGRGIDRKVTILCGAIEGQFPMFYKTDEVIGRELKNSESRHKRNEEELLNDLLFANDNLSEKVYFTHPRYDGSSEKIRSHYISDLIRLISNIQSINKDEVKLFNDTYELVKHDLDTYNIINLDYDIRESSRNGVLYNLSIDSNRQILKVSNSKFSATKIDSLKNFPYNFFVKNVMNLYGKDSYEETPMLSEIGLIYHAVIRGIYASFADLMKSENYPFYLKSKNTELDDVYPVDINLFSNYDDIINEQIDIVFSDFPDNEFFKFQKNLVHKKVFDFIDNEKEVFVVNGLYPSMHEFSIEQFQYAITLNSKEVIFTGTIDRVDLNYQNDVLQIGIVDYKSSDKKMKVTDDNTKGEHSFQMLIYLKAIKEIIKNNYELILNDKGITLNDDNVDFKYAYYYNLKSFEKATGCLNFYALQKINEKVPEKSIIIKDSLNFQEKLLSETYNRILEKNFEFNGNKNKYDEDVNLMIRY